MYKEGHKHRIGKRCDDESAHYYLDGKVEPPEGSQFRKESDGTLVLVREPSLASASFEA